MRGSGGRFGTPRSERKLGGQRWVVLETGADAGLRGPGARTVQQQRQHRGLRGEAGVVGVAQGALPRSGVWSAAPES